MTSDSRSYIRSQIKPFPCVATYPTSWAGSLTFQQIYDDLAAILGKESEAETAIQAFEDRLAAYAERSPRNLTVLALGTDGENFWVNTSHSVPCSIFNVVAICEWEDPNPQPGIWGYGTNIEGVLALNPDVIILESWVDELSAAELSEQLSASSALWIELTAVQTGRIFDDQGRDSYGIGPIGGTRLLDAYLPLLYPDVFPEPRTDEQVQEILAQ
jgi:ABC-type Fe3+-hydroxamate transport system substrate-binding protein